MKTFKPTKEQVQHLAGLLRDIPEPTPEQVSQIAQAVLLVDQTAVEDYIVDRLRKATWNPSSGPDTPNSTSFAICHSNCNVPNAKVGVI
jgi:hypothetical protein